MLKLSFYISLTLLTLGQFSSIAKIGGGKVYAFDIFIPLYVIVGLLYFIFVKKKFTVPKHFLGFIFFLIISFLSLFFSLMNYNLSEIVVGVFYLSRLISFVMFGLVIYNSINSGLISTSEMHSAVIISGLFLSIMGFIQLIVLPDFIVLDPALGWDPHKNRLASTFFDPNFTGQYLALCLILTLDRYFTKNKLSKFEVVASTLILIALFLTFSRSAWATFAIIVFIYGVIKSKAMLAVALLVAFSAYFAVPRVQTRISGATDPSDSASLRLISWSNAWVIAKDNFVTGVGFNNYKLAQYNYGLLSPDELNSHSASGTDSSLLLVLSTTGVVGFLSFLLAFAHPLFYKSKDKIMYFSLISGLFVGSIFINSLFFPQILFLYFVILTKHLSFRI